ncbi:zinc metalloprotease HtpX [Halorubrum gandharaense]
MRRLAVRAVMGVVGIFLLVAYLAAAGLAAWVLSWLWAARPDPLEVAAILAGMTLLSAYLSYRVGTAQLVRALESTRVPRDRAPAVHRRVDALTERMEIDRPELFVADMRAPNALAVGGSENGAVVLDRSLFHLLDPAELEAIIAHELAHLEADDGLIQAIGHGIGRMLAGLVTLVFLPALLALSGFAKASAWFRGQPFDRTGPFARLHWTLASVVMLVVVIGTLVVRARSRKREFAADDRAVAVTGDPIALARALRKIERASEPSWPLAPLSTNRETDDAIERWLSTHPPTDERIERLVERAEVESKRRGREGWTGVPVR